MSIYISDKNGNLKLVSGKFISTDSISEPSTISESVAYSNVDLSESECLIADITFGSATTMRILDGLDIVESDGSYEIIVEFPKTSVTGTFDISFNNYTYSITAFGDITVASGTSSTRVTNPAYISSSYFSPGSYSAYGTSLLKIKTTIINGDLIFESICTWKDGESSLSTARMYGTCPGISTLTGFEIFASNVVLQNVRLRIYKSTTNVAPTTTGEAYTEK